MTTRIDLDQADVLRGDPAEIVIGKDEKPARRHRPLPPKPSAKAHPVDFVAALRADLEDRYYVLAAEAERIRGAIVALDSEVPQ